MLLLTGCDFDVYKLPLPGGTDVGDDAITVKADFRDVLDLVPKSTVKVDDVSVGQVTDIDLDDGHAVVTMELRKDVDLPANARRRDPADQPARREVRLARAADRRRPPRARWPTAPSSRSTRRAATPRSRRCSARSA